MNFWDSEVWSSILSFGFISFIVLLSNTLVRKIPFLKKTLLPISVVGGFVALAFKLIGLTESFISSDFLNILTYQTLMIGFVALGLKVKKTKEVKKSAKPFDSGIVIVANYIMQGVLGMAFTFFMIKDFPAAGFLLPMGYGQGPGQANNIGIQYEAKGFVGGQAFGLSIASLGFVWACILGVVFLNVLAKKGKIKRKLESDDIVERTLTSADIEDVGEIPVSSSIDKFTIQIALVMITCLATYGLMFGLTYVLETFIGGSFIENTVKPLIWGFNFLFGTVMALVAQLIMKGMQKVGFMKRQYPNNYMLNRISGVAFDFMIIGSIMAIDVYSLEKLLLPLLVITTVGAFATFFFDYCICKEVYPDYPYEAFLAFYGMLTGTLSTGMILLREIDPEFETPAADCLVVGTTTAVIFGFPVLLLIGIAPDEPLLAFVLASIALVVCVLTLFRRRIFVRKPRNKD